MPTKPALSCCNPRWLARARYGAGAWVHAKSCPEVKRRASDLVTSDDMARRIFHHPSLLYLVAPVCDCNGCREYRDAIADHAYDTERGK